MKNYRSLALLLIIIISTTSCLREIFCEEGEGDLVTDVFVLEEFTGIDLQESANVTLLQGPEQKVEVTGHENILDRLKLEVNGGVWDISLGRDCYNDLDLAISITLPFVDELHVSGAGRIQVGDFKDLGNVDLSVTGSGRIEVGSFTGTEDVDVRISGSGEVLAKEPFPDLKALHVEMTGSGNFDGFKMSCEELDARITASGDMFVTATEKIDIRITGSGNLHYKGNPLIDANITGSGKIIDEN